MEETRPVIDLNGDAGEGVADDERFIAQLSSVNIACGAHAGDDQTMRKTLALAGELGVAAGAHPGYADPAHFGRRALGLSEESVRPLVAEQLERLAEHAAQLGVALTHVKPHGGLYHDASSNRAIAQAIAEATRQHDQRLGLVGPPHSALQDVAEESGLAFVAEGFADRAYLADGSLVARSESGALLVDPEQVLAQSIALASGKSFHCAEGQSLCLAVGTLCLHGDTPGAAERAALLRQGLADEGFQIRSPQHR